MGVQGVNDAVEAVFKQEIALVYSETVQKLHDSRYLSYFYVSMLSS